MRLLIATVAVVMLASSFSVDRLVPTPLQAADRVADILASTRKALGGDKLTAVKSLSAQGPFRRSMGQRDMEGTITLLVVRPDKYRRSEEMTMGGMVNGPTIERISVFNGTDAWDDVQNNGAVGGPGGGGFRMEIRGGPDGPGGPGGGGRGGPGAMLTPEQIAEQRTRRAKVELQRWTIALLADTTAEWVDAGVAESPDGKADMLETKDEAGRPVRFFIDQATHMPLMVQYQEIRPQIMIQGGGRGGRGPGAQGAAGAGTAGATGAGSGASRCHGCRDRGCRRRVPRVPVRERAAGRGSVQRRKKCRSASRRCAAIRRSPSTFAMHLGDYKKVDGVMLPHKIDISIDGQPNEEWTIEKYKINPTVKAAEFEKPKQ